MRANEKAKIFVKNFHDELSDYDMDVERAKNCAKSAVEMILEAIKTTTGHLTLRALDVQEVHSDIKYWESVKIEIDKITEI